MYSSNVDSNSYGTTYQCVQGEDFQLELTLTDDDNEPLNLTNFVITSEIQDLIGIVKATATITIADPLSGLFTVFFPRAQMQLLAGPYILSAKAIGATGNLQYVVLTNLTVFRSVASGGI